MSKVTSLSFSVLSVNGDNKIAYFVERHEDEISYSMKKNGRFCAGTGPFPPKLSLELINTLVTGIQPSRCTATSDLRFPKVVNNTNTSPQPSSETRSRLPSSPSPIPSGDTGKFAKKHFSSRDQHWHFSGTCSHLEREGCPNRSCEGGR